MIRPEAPEPGYARAVGDQTAEARDEAAASTADPQAPHSGFFTPPETAGATEPPTTPDAPPAEDSEPTAPSTKTFSVQMDGQSHVATLDIPVFGVADVHTDPAEVAVVSWMAAAGNPEKTWLTLRGPRPNMSVEVTVTLTTT